MTTCRFFFPIFRLKLSCILIPKIEMPTTIEIKAFCKSPEKARETLRAHHANFRGTEKQIDTYFHSKTGRLKFREGGTEKQLILYQRENQKGVKESQISLYKTSPDSSLKEILEKSIGTTCIVEKTREIYSIENVVFHIDQVKGLGNFLEIEAIDMNANISKDKLQEQCNYYIKLLEINAKDLVAESYSDLLQQNNLFNQIFIEE